MNTEADKPIIRAWSAVVARGLEGTPAEVVEEMKATGAAADLDLAAITRRMFVLRAMGHLPKEAT